MQTEETVQIEFTLTQDGRLDYRGCSDPELIYQLSCRAAEQAAAYQRAQSQPKQDPLAVAIVVFMMICLGALTLKIVTRPAPHYSPVEVQRAL